MNAKLQAQRAAAEKVRDRLVPALGQVGAEQIDIGAEAASLVVRVHFRRLPKQRPAALPEQMDGIPIRMMASGDYKLE